MTPFPLFRSIIKFGLFPILSLVAQNASARPDYALANGINRCTACHYSPAGGGPRNLNGKYYGTAGYKISPFSAQPYAGGEFKMLYYSPDRHTQAIGGAGIMAGAIWAALPLTESPSGKSETRIVAEHNIGGFSAAPVRNLYLQFAPKDDLTNSLLPTHFEIGRIIPPFGIMTDEHRTYVRMQTATMWNQHVRVGALASANPVDMIHYDLGIFNGQTANGTATGAAGQSAQWSYFGNLRIMPSRGGFFLGASASFSEPDPGPNQLSKSAQSVYGAISLTRLTGAWINATILAEYAQAKNWNASFSSLLVSDTTTYAPSIASSSSEGYLTQVNWDLSPRFQLQYKYDVLMLDRDYPADAYQRHGFGFRYIFGPNMWLQARYENAFAGRPGEEAGTKTGGLNAFWSVLNVGI